MNNGNTLLSDTAQKAVERIRTLQTISQKTGIQTREEQVRILLALENADALAVADVIGVKGGAR
jgi:hypothetical protein